MNLIHLVDEISDKNQSILSIIKLYSKFTTVKSTVITSTKQKKGKEFLPYKERKIIMSALKNVMDVISFDDSDKTCVDGIRKSIEKYPNQKIKFANGGDRSHNTTPSPEKVYCEQNKIEVLWEIGGNNKTNSSSWILKQWQQR